MFVRASYCLIPALKQRTRVIWIANKTVSAGIKRISVVTTWVSKRTWRWWTSAHFIPPNDIKKCNLQNSCPRVLLRFLLVGVWPTDFLSVSYQLPIRTRFINKLVNKVGESTSWGVLQLRVVRNDTCAADGPRLENAREQSSINPLSLLRVAVDQRRGLDDGNMRGKTGVPRVRRQT